MTSISILGVSGSIGRQALDVCAGLNAASPNQMHVCAMTAGKDWRFLAEAARKFRPSFVAVAAESCYEDLRAALADLPIEIGCGPAALQKAAAYPDAELTLAAISGTACLPPLISAIKAGKDIALANKEALVAAGRLILDLAAIYNVELRPVDSEHSAIYQCLQGEDKKTVKSIILTASGGPFRSQPPCLDKISPQQALAHPSWRMGPKITVDSATMVNKGLEIIEAHWLFGMDYDHIEVLVHPESIIHSLVEYADGSQKALLSVPDMRLPIQYALTGRSRQDSPLARLDLASLGKLSFYYPDEQRFPALRIFSEAGRRGGLWPAYLNGANETLVSLFLQEKISFTAISAVLQQMLDKEDAVGEISDLAAVLAADKQGREDAALMCGHLKY